MSVNDDNYRHVDFIMCLAIVMYITTGALSIIQHLLSMTGVFLLTLLGRVILLIDRIVTKGTLRERRRNPIHTERDSYTDSEEDYVNRSVTSLESRHSRTRSVTIQTSQSILETPISTWYTSCLYRWYFNWYYSNL